MFDIVDVVGRARQVPAHEQCLPSVSELNKSQLAARREQLKSDLVAAAAALQELEDALQAFFIEIGQDADMLQTGYERSVRDEISDKRLELRAVCKRLKWLQGQMPP
jgi:phosphoglycerate-specific signal transduction histidine kinase